MIPGHKSSDQITKDGALFYVIRKTKKKNGAAYTEQDKIEKIRSLLSQDAGAVADINAQDKNDNDNTILHIAVQNRYDEIITFLVQENGARTDIKDAQGKSVTDIARDSKDNTLTSLLQGPGITKDSNTRKRGAEAKDDSGIPEKQHKTIQHEEIRTQHKSHLHKSHVRDFVSHLFGIKVSDRVLVDINISENPNDNQVTIVGRPAVLGSSKKQMRHITPYSFIVNAITSRIETEQKQVLLSVIPSLIQTIIPPLLTMKEGICLSKDDFESWMAENEEKMLFNNKKLTSIDLYETKLETVTHDNSRNVYYLINNSDVIKEWKKYKNNSDDDIKKAQEGYYDKWCKYIRFAMQYLNEAVQSNEYAIISSAELIARLILTLFNQSRYACFAEEGNTLSEEIRVYFTHEDAKKHKDNYTVYSHAKICTDTEYSKVEDKKDPLIRIVDNEGSIVKRASRALELINSMLSFQGAEYEQARFEKFVNEYNGKIERDSSQAALPECNAQLSRENYKDTYAYHVAKHLYSVFDFKPLEEEVLVPTTSKGRQGLVQVYPSATGTSISHYAKKNGGDYRTESYNAAKGYNEHAVFRHLFDDDQTKKLLVEKMISHFFISLIPFPHLINPGSEENQSKNLLETTFKAFYTLVQQDYLKVSNIELGKFFDENNVLCQGAREKWEKILKNITSDLNSSNVSSTIDHVEVQAAQISIATVPECF